MSPLNKFASSPERARQQDENLLKYRGPTQAALDAADVLIAIYDKEDREGCKAAEKWLLGDS